jgi:hypothetical protein
MGKMCKPKPKAKKRKVIKHRGVKLAWLKTKIALANAQSDMTLALKDGDWLLADLSQDGADRAREAMKLNPLFKFDPRRRRTKGLW